MKELVLTSIPKEDLETLIIDCVNACLKHYKPKNEVKKPIQQEGYLTKKEAAKLLSCSTSTIDNYRRNGTLKKYDLGGTVRFKRADVIALIEGKSKKKEDTKSSNKNNLKDGQSYGK